MNKKAGIVLGKLINIILILSVFIVASIAFSKGFNIAKESAFSSIGFVNDFVFTSSSPIKKVTFEGDKMKLDFKTNFNKKISYEWIIATDNSDSSVVEKNSIDTSKKKSVEVNIPFSEIQNSIFSRLDFQIYSEGTSEKDKEFISKQTFFIINFDDLFKNGQTVREFKNNFKNLFSSSLSLSRTDVDKLYYILSYISNGRQRSVTSISFHLITYCETAISYKVSWNECLDKMNTDYAFFSRAFNSIGSYNKDILEQILSSSYDEGKVYTQNSILPERYSDYLFFPSLDDLPSDLNIHVVEHNNKNFIVIKKTW